MSASLKLRCFLRRIGTRMIAHHYIRQDEAVGESSSCVWSLRVADAIIEVLGPTYLSYASCCVMVHDSWPPRWPDEEKLKMFAANFKELAGFPDVVGLIDGTHVQIYKPWGHARPDRFTNRHSRYSMVLIVITGPNKEVLYVCILHIQLQCDLIDQASFGFAGAASDSMAFQASDFWQNIELYIPQEHHILGDQGFPLHKHLLTRYHDRDQNPVHQAYNAAHKGTRYLVECAIGEWKVGVFMR